VESGIVLKDKDTIKNQVLLIFSILQNPSPDPSPSTNKSPLEFELAGF
jgi:hypothetical protein